MSSEEESENSTLPNWMEEQKNFISYDKFEVDKESNKIRFYYSLNDSSKYCSLLSLDLENYNENSKIQKESIFHIGMVLISWMYMGFATPLIIVRARPLSSSQLSFWHHFYENALAEFFFVNRINFINYFSIQVDYNNENENENELNDNINNNKNIIDSGDKNKEEKDKEEEEEEENIRVIVPMGGGKDSIVVYEMIKKIAETSKKKIEYQWLYIGNSSNEYKSNWRLNSISQISQREKEEYFPPIVMEFELYAKGENENKFFDQFWRDREKEIACPPWAALVAFSSVFICHLHNFNYISVGNERSANFGNCFYLGREINHQFDKSFDFESKFHHYLLQYLTTTTSTPTTTSTTSTSSPSSSSSSSQSPSSFTPPLISLAEQSISRKRSKTDIYYFSALQHLWEVQIAEIFSIHTEYIPLFVSCNETTMKGTRWCSKCPKCLFIFILLSSFLSPPFVWSIFGNNLFEISKLFPIINQLMGLTTVKPFDCVGTPEEVSLSLYLAFNQYKIYNSQFKNEYLKERNFPLFFKSKSFLSLNFDELEKKFLLFDFNPQNLLPDWFDLSLLDFDTLSFRQSQNNN